jgi:hypothetical protein
MVRNVVPCNVMQCNVMGCYGMFCYLIWRVGEQKHFVRVCIPSLRWKQPLSLIARNFALTRRTHSFSTHLNMEWVIQCGALFTIAKLVQNNSNNYGVWYLYLTYNFIVFMGFINQLKNQLITGGGGPIFKFCITVIPASADRCPRSNHVPNWKARQLRPVSRQTIARWWPPSDLKVVYNNH